MSFFVYIHTCPNQKRYVGVTVRKPARRWKNGKGYLNNEHFTNAINKYGWDNIEHEVFETQSVELMSYWERILIYHYNTMNREYGFNHTSGGEIGKELSEEALKKISKANKGKVMSEESRQKMSKSRKGRYVTVETRKKMSEAKKGCTPWIKGRTLSEETKKKMSEAKKLYWENKRKNNT